ncbi:hypothetical protein [Clostridium sp. CCUG 7971]|nr:hypothetical protein [Clostridium sp. CCUG 7971]MBO3443078.1 hypothetical protein [Clostridium sp. CCUG 7971]
MQKNRGLILNLHSIIPKKAQPLCYEDLFRRLIEELSMVKGEEISRST